MPFSTTYASHGISVDRDPLLSGGRVAADAHPHAHAAVALHAPHLSRAYTQLPQTTLQSDIHISMLSLKTIILMREFNCTLILDHSPPMPSSGPVLPAALFPFSFILIHTVSSLALIKKGRTRHVDL